MSIYPLLLGLILTTSACSEQAPSTSSLKIMPLGDSITQGVGNDYAPAPDLDSYRRALYLQLTQAGYEVDFVGSMQNTFNCGAPAKQDFDADHEGHWAWRVDEIINGKNDGCRGSGKLADWLPGNIPDIALVHLGTNDAFQNQSVESTLQELGQIVDILRAANPRVAVLIAKLLPVAEPQNSQRINQLNEQIHLVAELKNSHQSRVIIVDHHQDFDATTETFDGVHPNLLGEQKMAQRWFKAIEKHIAK